MKDDRDRRERQTGGSTKNPRTDRLKLALRENLKRRKSQARARSDVTMAPSNGDNASPHDASGKKPGKYPGLAPDRNCYVLLSYDFRQPRTCTAQLQIRLMAFRPW